MNVCKYLDSASIWLHTVRFDWVEVPDIQRSGQRGQVWMYRQDSSKGSGLISNSNSIQTSGRRVQVWSVRRVGSGVRTYWHKRPHIWLSHLRGPDFSAAVVKFSSWSSSAERQVSRALDLCVAKSRHMNDANFGKVSPRGLDLWTEALTHLTFDYKGSGLLRGKVDISS